MKIGDIRNMSNDDISRLNKDQMKEAAQIASSASNRKYKKLLDSGEYTPAAKSYELNAGLRNRNHLSKADIYKRVKTSTKNKTYNELKTELYRSLKFDSLLTSTKRGNRVAQTRAKDSLKESGVDINKLSKRDQKNMWKAYNQLKNSPDSGVLAYAYNNGSAAMFESVIEAITSSGGNNNLDSFKDAFNDLIEKDKKGDVDEENEVSIFKQFEEVSGEFDSTNSGNGYSYNK